MRYSLCLGLGCSVNSSFAKEYSFTNILEMAVGQNPRLDKIQASHDSSVAQVNVGKADIYPAVTFDSSYKYLDRPNQPPMMGSNEQRLQGTNFDWSLKVVQSLSPLRLGLAQKIAERSEKIFDLKQELDQDMYYLDVIKAYGDALIALERDRVMKNATGQLEAVLVFTEIEADGGARDKVDLLRARAAYETAQANSALASVTLDTKIQWLKVLLGREGDQEFGLSKNKNEATPFLLVDSKVVSGRGLKIKKIEHDVAALKVDVEKSYHWPAFSFFAQVAGNTAEYKNIPGGKGPEYGFDSMRRNYAVGVNMNWQLFTGMRISSRHRKAVEDAKMASIEVEELRKIEGSQQVEAKKKFEVSGLVYKASQSSAYAARLAFEQANTDYKEGQLRLTDLLEAEQELRTKEEQLTEAWVNWLLAAANLRLTNGQRVLGDG